MRSPTAWLGAILLASILPAAWDAYRAHTIGWVGAIDNTQDRLDPNTRSDGLIPYRHPLRLSLSADNEGALLIQVDSSGYYVVGIDRRDFVALSYRANGMIVEPKLETMSIAEVRHFTEPVQHTVPQVEPLEPPYPEWLMRNIEQNLPIKFVIAWPYGMAPSSQFLPTVWHEGVMEPRAIHDEDSKPITNDAGELERTPEHVFAFYRLTDGSLGSPISWDRFWVQAWGVLKRTMPIPIVLCVLWYVGYLSLYFKRRTRRRLKLGLCIKCAYPMQEDRGGEGLICTECGHRG
tara:strand:+ start:128375 stop:129247 length:873 start_codon:yes stop_codon:yes gene_type:complete